MKFKLYQQWYEAILFFMKFSTVQLVISVLLASVAIANTSSGQGLLDKQISLHAEEVELRTVLADFEKLAAVKFAYSPRMIRVRQVVSVEAEQEKLGDVLNKLLVPLDLSYRLIGGRILIYKTPTVSAEVVDPLSLDARLAAIQVSGVVTDENGSLLPGVNIVEEGTTNGTTTDATGTYSISVEGENSVLVFSFIGYAPKEVVVGPRTTLDVSLSPDVKSLQEVIVIGYGSREKKDVTGAISTVGSDEIAKNISVNPESAMQGRMAGVFVSSPGGSPTARPTVRVRGQSTFNIADPLYVVDGVPLFEFGNGIQGGSTGEIRGTVNVLSLINPGDIESMTVLKDAAASAIYGSRAANGVILITTKKGKKGAPRVEFNSSVGFQNVANKYDVLPTGEFAALYREMFDARAEYDRVYAPTPNPDAPYLWETTPGFNVFNPASTDPYYQYLGNSPTYDWQSELINRNAKVNDYSVRVSGGSENTTYYIGGGYSEMESPLINNYLDRYSLSSNVHSKISKYVETGLSYQVSYVDAFDNTFFGGNLANASRVSPWQPIYDPNDPRGFARTTDIAFVENPDFDLSSASPGPKFNIVPGSQEMRPWGPESNTNFFAQLALRDNSYTLLKNFGTAYVQVNPFDGLTIKGSISVDLVSNRRNEWTNLDEARFNETPSNPYDGHDGSAVGRYSVSETTNTNILKDLTLRYERAFGDHSLELLLNASDQQMMFQTSGAGSPVNFEDEQFRSVGGDPRWVSGGASGTDKKALQGYVGRLSYRYKDKYYLDASMRRDGSSQFAPEKRWGNFPGVSAAWRLTSEDFFSALDRVVDDLKLRVGYGTLGNTFSTNTGFSDFPYLSSINSNPTYALGSGNGNPYGVNYFGAFLPTLANRALTWEKAKTFNIGADAAFLAGRLTATIEYYSKDTENIIQKVPPPLSAGVKDDVQINVASVRNSGMEIELGYVQQFNKVKFDVSGNFTTVRNRVTELFNGIDNYFGGLAVGYPIGFIAAYKVGGIFQTQEEIDAYRETTVDTRGANQRPGDIWFVDVHGPQAEGTNANFSEGADGQVDGYDRTYVGKTIPGYFYGLRLSAEYSGFDLSLFFQGVGDVQKYNSERASGESLSGQGLNMWTSVRDRWTPDNPSTTMPRAIFGDPNGNGRYSDRFVEDADFLRLKNVQLGYTIPASVLAKTKVISGVRLYVNGSNLLTFTKWEGIDPENDQIPPTRVVSFGLNASF